MIWSADNKLIAPAFPASINPSHPLAIGLLFFYLFDTQQGGFVANQVNGTTMQRPELAFGQSRPSPNLQGSSFPSPLWRIGPEGLSPNFSGSGSLNWRLDFSKNGLEPASAVTMVGRVRRNGTNNQYSTPFEKTIKNNSVSPFHSYGLAYNPAGGGQNKITTVVSSASNGNFQGSVYNAADTTLPHTVGMSYTSGSLKLWYNGINRVTDTTPTGNITYPGNATDVFVVGGSGGGSPMWVGEVYWVGVWNRVLSPNEHWLLYTEPYSLVMPNLPRARIFVPFASTQTFNPDLLSDETFYTPSETSPFTAAMPLLDDHAFYTPVEGSGSVSFTPPLLDTHSFYTPKVQQTGKPALLGDEVFYTPTEISGAETTFPPLLDEHTFYTPTGAFPITTPAPLLDEHAFFTPQAIFAQTGYPPLIFEGIVYMPGIPFFRQQHIFT